MTRDVLAISPQVDKLVELYDLDAEPAQMFVAGQNGGLDYAGLRFGAKYRATADLKASSSGALAKGDKVYFLGYQIFADRDGLRLYLERPDQTKLQLNFDGDSAEEPGVVRMITRGADHFATTTFDFLKRRKQLIAARAVLLHLRKKEAQP